MTAKQVILQRLREATDEVHYGEYVGRDGDLVTGVIQAHESRSEKGIVSVDLGKLEAMLPPVRAGARASRTSTASGSSASWCTWPRASAARRSRCPGRTRAWSRSCSRWRCRRSPTARWRSPRSPARPATVPRSRYGRPPPGSTPRAPASGRWAQRVRAVMSELHGEKIDIIDWSDDPADFVGNALSPAKALRVEVVDAGHPDRPGDRAGLPALAGHRPGGAERPARRPADRLAHRHPARQRRRAETPGRRGRRCPITAAGAGRRRSIAPDQLSRVDFREWYVARPRCAPVWVAGDAHQPPSCCGSSRSGRAGRLTSSARA